MARGYTDLWRSTVQLVRRAVADAETVTRYRDPLVAFADADDSRFARLREVADPDHLMPHDLLSRARSVISFFVPFHPDVVSAHADYPETVADEWACAYVETNDLIREIAHQLIEFFDERGEEAAAEPATGNFDAGSLTSRWSHKSAAVISGLGSFGLHQMVITDAGCAGRLGSLVTSARLPVSSVEPRERCLYFYDGSCTTCMQRCPLDALSASDTFDRRACWGRCREVAEHFLHLGTVKACGKCAVGPCALESPVPITEHRGQMPASRG